MYMAYGLLLNNIFAAKTKKIQVESEAGKSISIDCRPESKSLNISWILDGQVLVPDSKYSFGDANNISMVILTINKVTFEDRKDFTCIIELPDITGNITTTSETARKFVKKIFRLRVRDRYGAIWPTIGIVIEIIVLFVVIKMAESISKSNTRQSRRNSNRIHPLSKNSSVKVKSFDMTKEFNGGFNDDSKRRKSSVTVTE